MPKFQVFFTASYTECKCYEVEADDEEAAVELAEKELDNLGVEDLEITLEPCDYTWDGIIELEDE